MKRIKWLSRSKYLFMIVMALMIISCDDEEVVPPDSTIDYSEGVFIINEGQFQTGTGTISYLNRENTIVKHRIFQNANSMLPLGNIVQSMNVIDNKAFIVVNNADKIEIASENSFQTMGTLPDINQPRYIVSVGGTKTYISCWDNTVKIYDYEAYKVFGQIPVGTGPEKMLVTGNEVWVLNQGGLSIDSTISIINTTNDQLITTLQVFSKPTGIQKDKNGKMWVLCSGQGYNNYPQETDTKGHLLCIDPETYSIEKDIVFPSVSKHPEKLVINSKGDVLFYNYPSGIYKFEIYSAVLEDTPFIARDGDLYGLGLDKTNDVIYSSDPLDYVQNGWVFRYNALNGSSIDSLEAGIIPGEFYFSE